MLHQNHPRPFAFRISTDAEPRRVLVSSAVVGAFLLTGALPVLTIAAHVFGAAHLHDTARFMVLPAVVFALLLWRTDEANWAGHGLVGGIIAVAAYDVVRVPSGLAEVWPDFVPRLGGWIIGVSGEDAVVGYLWRYIGDGGGIGLAFFMLCGILGVRHGSALGRFPVLLGIGYGVFVWLGLMGTILFSEKGPALLFCLTTECVFLSFAGHIVYGAVLGLCYRAFLDGSLNLRNIR